MSKYNTVSSFQEVCSLFVLLGAAFFCCRNHFLQSHVISGGLADSDRNQNFIGVVFIFSEIDTFFLPDFGKGHLISFKV